MCAHFSHLVLLWACLVGGAISVVGGATLLGTEITNGVLRSGKFKEVERALEKDKDATSELVKKLENLEGILKETNELIVKIPKIVFNVGSTVNNGVQTPVQSLPRQD